MPVLLPIQIVTASAAVTVYRTVLLADEDAITLI
jgi:hypothetical protein